MNRVYAWLNNEMIEINCAVWIDLDEVEFFAAAGGGVGSGRRGAVRIKFAPPEGESIAHTVRGEEAEALRASLLGLAKGGTRVNP